MVGRSAASSAAGAVSRLGSAGCLAAATALLVAGCSSSGGGSGSGGSGSSTPSTFSAALAEIPSTSWDGSYFEFGDADAVTRLNNASSGKSALYAYTMIGESTLMEADQGDLGFNPLTVSSAVTVGDAPPRQTTVLYGSFNPSTIGTKLSGLGFKQDGSADGGTLWVITAAKSGENNPTNDPELNVLDVSADRIVLGDSTADVEAIAAAGTHSLGSNATLAALANCLGSAKAGLIGSYPPGQAQSSTYVGIGLLASSADDASEELCVTAPSSAKAASIEANWKQRIEHGTTVTLDEPWSKLFTDPQATTVGSAPIVVRLMAQRAPGARVGALLTDYENPYVDFSNLIDQSAS